MIRRQAIESDEALLNMYRGDSARSPIINAEVMFDDDILTQGRIDQLAVGRPGP